MPIDLEFTAPTVIPSTDTCETAGGSEPVSNLVLLTGALSEPAERRDLAGGIPVVRWTLRVPRGAGLTGTDLMDCIALTDDMQQRALGWPVGLPIAVVGALRRRFFRSGGRTTTRVEIEVNRVTELDVPAAAGSAKQPDQ